MIQVPHGAFWRNKKPPRVVIQFDYLHQLQEGELCIF